MMTVFLNGEKLNNNNNMDNILEKIKREAGLFGYIVEATEHQNVYNIPGKLFNLEFNTKTGNILLNMNKVERVMDEELAEELSEMRTLREDLQDLFIK